MRISWRGAIAVAAVATLSGASAGELCAAGQQAAVVVIQTVIQPRASLRVSDEALFILPGAPGDTGPRVVGTIDFRAAARTSGPGEVLLTVEPLGDLGASGGPAGEPATIDFAGAGDGALNGSLVTNQPSAAGRWTGPGVREGRLTFTLRGVVGADGIVVPLRFVLATP